MDKKVINKIAEMCVELSLNNGFYFTVCEKNNNEVKYSVGVKLIEEFSSLLVLIGNCGGGFNRVFLANKNMDDRETLMVNWITEELTDEFREYHFIGIEIDYVTNIDDFKNKSMVLKTTDCDGKIQTREYNTVNEFINHVGSEDEKVAFTAPMLDDEIDTVIINEIKINIGDFKTLNDFCNVIK